jgi:hypothetical protein
MRKTAIYSAMNSEFLRELAENLNLSFRSYTDTDKTTLVKLLDKKIDQGKTEIIFKMYLTATRNAQGQDTLHERATQLRINQTTA